MKKIHYIMLIIIAPVFVSCYTTTPKYLFAPNSANLLQIENNGEAKAAINYAQSRHSGNNDDSPGIQTSNGVDIQSAYGITNHLVLKADVFKKWEIDKAINNNPTNSSRYKLDYKRQGTALSIGYYKYLSKSKEILFNIDAGLVLGKNSFNGTYRQDASTQYFYSGNNRSLFITPSIRFIISKHYNLTLAYRLSNVSFSNIKTNDSTLKKGLYLAFANKPSTYGDTIIDNNFGFNSLPALTFHLQLGVSNLYTHFTYTPTSSYQDFMDQYEYNNSFVSLGVVADLKQMFKNKTAN